MIYFRFLDIPAYFIAYIIISFFGLSIGSFLNVCIYRIPLKQDIVKLPSHCMSCGRKLKWYELIPVFSFLIQGGKCRSCKTKLSVQYPIIELLNGLLYVLVFYLYGESYQTVVYCLLASVLIVISVIDFRTYDKSNFNHLKIFILFIFGTECDKYRKIAEIVYMVVDGADSE